MLNGELSDEDLCKLTEICKCTHGLAEQHKTAPLAEEHVPDEAAGAAPVSLVSIFHHRGVNALANDQTLMPAPAMTVVYGDNGPTKPVMSESSRARVGCH